LEVSNHLHAPTGLPHGKDVAVFIEYEDAWTQELVWTLCSSIVESITQFLFDLLDLHEI
jgi:hypothetical protein